MPHARSIQGIRGGGRKTYGFVVRPSYPATTTMAIAMAMAMVDGDERLRNKERRISEYGVNEDGGSSSLSSSIF